MTDGLWESKILELASYTGRLILQNGGEVSRAEDVIARVGRYYGYEIDAFVTLTCIFVSTKGKDNKFYSQVTRIKVRDLNLHKVAEVNRVVRHIAEYNYDEFYEQLKFIEKNYCLEFIRYIIGCIMIGGSFCILFNAGYKEVIIGSIGGFLVALLVKFLNKYQVNGVIVNILGAMLCSFVAYYATYFGYTKETSTVIISQLMIFVPGIAFVNTVRDLLAGDLVAGISRFTEVVMVATSLAVGAGIAFKIYISLGGVVY